MRPAPSPILASYQTAGWVRVQWWLGVILTSVLAAGSLLLALFAHHAAVAVFLGCTGLGWLTLAIVGLRVTGRTLAWTVGVSETEVRFIGPFLNLRLAPSDVLEVRMFGALSGRTGFKVHTQMRGVIRLGPAPGDTNFLRALRVVNPEARLPADF